LIDERCKECVRDLLSIGFHAGFVRDNATALVGPQSVMHA